MISAPFAAYDRLCGISVSEALPSTGLFSRRRCLHIKRAKKSIDIFLLFVLSIGQTSPVKSLKPVSKTISLAFHHYSPKGFMLLIFKTFLPSAYLVSLLNGSNKFEYRLCFSTLSFSINCFLSLSAFLVLLSGDCCGNKARMSLYLDEVVLLMQPF